MLNGKTTDSGRAWHASTRIGRVQIGVRVYLHEYEPNRWVFQPWAIYDCKPMVRNGRSPEGGAV